MTGEETLGYRSIASCSMTEFLKSFLELLLNENEVPHLGMSCIPCNMVGWSSSQKGNSIVSFKEVFQSQASYFLTCAHS